MQYFSDEQLDDMFGMLDLEQLNMMGYDLDSDSPDHLEDLLMAIEEDFSELDREEKISELRSVGAFDDEDLVDEVKMSADWTDTEKHQGNFLEDLSRRGREAYMKLSPEEKKEWKYKWKYSGRPKGQRTRFTDLLEPKITPQGWAQRDEFMAETKRQRLKREKDEAAMDDASTDVEYMREHYAESKKFYASGASYLGSGSLMDIHKDTGLDAFSPSELATSSAIHGDFDQASLNYSGHQNIEVRAETFEAASTSPPNLAREKSNLRDAIRTEIDSNFEYNQVVWGPYWVRFEAHNSNKWYGILVYNNGKGVFRALGGYGGMGNNPNLVDLATTRSQAQAESAAKRRLKAKERKGYFAYSAEFEQLSDAAVAVSDRYDVNVGYIVATDGDDDEGDDDVTISITDDEMEPIAEVDLGQSWHDYNPDDEDYYHSEQYYAADSPFNTMLLIRHDVVIEEETDFNHLLQIYLELEQDIAYLFSTDGEKHHLLPEMIRYRNQIATRLDQIQEEVEIQDTIEMDAETPYDSTTHIILDTY